MEKIKDNNASGEFWGKILFYYFLSLVVAVPVFLVREASMIDGFFTFIAYLIVVSIKALLWPLILLLNILG